MLSLSLDEKQQVIEDMFVLQYVKIGKKILCACRAGNTISKLISSIHEKLLIIKTMFPGDLLKS